jgi:predicted RNA-binding Zn ribbon-like protein
MTEVAMRRRFEILAGEMCLDLANTIGGLRGGNGDEFLQTYADLVEWGEAAGLVAPAAGRRLRREGERRAVAAAAVLARARALREIIFRIFDAMAMERLPSPVDIDALNAELARALPHARLTRTAAGFGWTWADPESSLEALLWPVVGSAGRLVAAQNGIVRACRSESCSWLFVDRSKNHSRRWCAMRTCGNRAKSRAHRRRA